jgi:hypothetical protein
MRTQRNCVRRLEFSDYHLRQCKGATPVVCSCVSVLFLSPLFSFAVWSFHLAFVCLLGSAASSADGCSCSGVGGSAGACVGVGEQQLLVSHLTRLWCTAYFPPLQSLSTFPFISIGQWTALHSNSFQVDRGVTGPACKPESKESYDGG